MTGKAGWQFVTTYTPKPLLEDVDAFWKAQGFASRSHFTRAAWQFYVKWCAK